MFSEGLLIGKRNFQGMAMPKKEVSFLGHIDNKFGGPTILHLNIEGLTASKMKILYYLALQYEVFVILLQEIHCANAEKLVVPSYQLEGSSLSIKHTLATFLHKRLRYTLWDQSPLTSKFD